MNRRGLEEIEGVVLDLDGVVYRGTVPIPGAVERIEELRGRGVRVVFCTNNSRATVAQYVEKLAGVGLDAAHDEIVTSAVVTGEVLAARNRYRTAFVIGGDGVREAVGNAGIAPVEGRAAEAAELVAVGWDPGFDYAALRIGTQAILGGAGFVATNDDATFPAEGGQLWPGAGPIVAALEFATKRQAEVMGKPHRPMMEAVAARLAPATRITVVGDRPDTDLAGARVMGWPSVLVLSGVTRRDEARRLNPAPDRIIESLADL
jgi:phosphoglycolate/pyridoxal phosphate phosphatase family enzyme